MGKVTVELAATAFRPGDEVRGQVTWELAEAPAGGELRLRWDTAGKGDADGEVVGVAPLAELVRPPDPARAGASHPYRASAAAASDVPPLAARDRRTFRFPLPDRPVSFSGKLITLTWSVEVEVGGERHRVEIVLSPSAREVRL